MVNLSPEADAALQKVMYLFSLRGELESRRQATSDATKKCRLQIRKCEESLLKEYDPVIYQEWTTCRRKDGQLWTSYLEASDTCERWDRDVKVAQEVFWDAMNSIVQTQGNRYSSSGVSLPGGSGFLESKIA